MILQARQYVAGYVLFITNVPLNFSLYGDATKYEQHEDDWNGSDGDPKLC